MINDPVLRNPIPGDLAHMLSPGSDDDRLPLASQEDNES